MDKTIRPYTAKYIYNLLDLKQTGNSVDRIGATLFNSKIKLTPHQIKAALFAFKSPLSKGSILADEVGLGKTIEAGIVLAQLWNEHKRKILIVGPASLLRQWSAELLEKFNLPSIVMDRKNYNLLKKSGFRNPFIQKDAIIICSYHMCAASKEDIIKASFDLCVIDEAHKLRNVWTGKNVISTDIKTALINTKKILLTATPIQNNVMDLYGLTTLIDDNIFSDHQLFKEKYFKNYSDNLIELKDRLDKFTQRTLREQVKPYIKFTKRIPKTFTFTQTHEELVVYNLIRELLLNSHEESYLIPNRQKHLLLLILCKLMGSSIYSIVFTLETMKKRLVTLLNTGIDTGLDASVDDLLDEDELEDLNNLVQEQKLVIDREKLKKEIDNLSIIIEKAKKVKIESKYLALKDAINFGNKLLSDLGANNKVLIFTESRRTQSYLYEALKSDGYDDVILFNGSNNDSFSTLIYEEWCKKPENIEKLSNSKAVNLRQAIIDYFKEKGKILIATGAGAEGLNLQFCSLVINYDLPWNPQVVEQRIGRCHRFGQEYDVAVINFLSSSNAVEQRIYELLSSKFQVFNDVFGSSDSILGSWEDGSDLEKKIIEIYTKCRTVEEIDLAFNKIQEEYKDVIDESMKKTKQDLLENFDEDLQVYFSGVLDETQNSINKIEELFWRLTKIILHKSASFDDDTKSFNHGNEKYRLSILNDGTYIDYNMSSTLGKKVMVAAENVQLNYGHVDFNITNYPYKINSIIEMIGKKGYISLSKIVIDSFEREEQLIFKGMFNDGTPISEEIIEKMFRLDTVETENSLIPIDVVQRLSNDTFLHGMMVV